MKTVLGHFKNCLLYTILLLVIPPFLNYTALLREDKEFKEQGNFQVLFQIRNSEDKLLNLVRIGQSINQGRSHESQEGSNMKRFLNQRKVASEGTKC